MKSLSLSLFFTFLCIANSEAQVSKYKLKDTTQHNQMLIDEQKGSIHISMRVQVGGRGGIQATQLVDFPTVCWLEEVGAIKSKSKSNISYRALSVRKMDKYRSKTWDAEKEHDNDSRCDEYVTKFNEIVKHQRVQFTISLEDYILEK